MEHYICSFYSISELVCNHPLDKYIKDAGYNKQEGHKFKQCYEQGQLREKLARDANNAGLVLEGQLVLPL